MTGATVRTLRGEMELTQQELADRCRISKSYLSAIENGHATNFSYAIAVRLTDALAVPLGSLYPTTPEAA